MLAAAPGLVTVPLKIDQLGNPGNQLRDPAGLVVSEPAVRDGNCAVRLTIDMGQYNSIGVNDPAPAAMVRPSRG